MEAFFAFRKRERERDLSIENMRNQPGSIACKRDRRVNECGRL
jgi:hypothetical protein